MNILKSIVFAPLFGLAGILLAYWVYFCLGVLFGFFMPSFLFLIFGYEVVESIGIWINQTTGITGEFTRFSNMATAVIFILGAIIGVWYSFDNTIFDTKEV